MSIGFIIALVVFLAALGGALGLFNVAHLLLWLIALLALAVLLGGLSISQGGVAWR